MTQADRYNYWLTFHRFQQSREKKYSPQILKALKEQYNQYIHLIKSGHNPTSSLIHISSQPIVKVLKPLYIDCGVTYGAKVRASLPRLKARMPIGFNERMVQLLNDYFQSDILNDSEAITETTRNEIQKVLIQANEESRGIDWIVAQLQDNTELNYKRSRVIARTETVTAANQGAMFAAKDTGIKLNKEWLAVMDNRTRDDHRIADGQKVPLDKPFDVHGYMMQQPGDRGSGGLPTAPKEYVNCRCTVIFAAVRDRAGRLVAS